MKVQLRCPQCSVKIQLTVRPGSGGRRARLNCPRCYQRIRTVLPKSPAANRETKEPLDIEDIMKLFRDRY